ncbi:hypothetical protein VTN96DRAFT_5819 [Rasamsonia emersonii]
MLEPQARLTQLPLSCVCDWDSDCESVCYRTRLNEDDRIGCSALIWKTNACPAILNARKLLSQNIKHAIFAELESWKALLCGYFHANPLLSRFPLQAAYAHVLRGIFLVPLDKAPSLSQLFRVKMGSLSTHQKQHGSILR